MACGDQADDIVVVGIIINARDPRRVGGAGVGERSEGNVTSEEKEDEQTPDSHIAEPTPAPPQGQASARGGATASSAYTYWPGAFVSVFGASGETQPRWRGRERAAGAGRGCVDGLIEHHPVYSESLELAHHGHQGIARRGQAVRLPTRPNNVPP